MPTFPRLPGLPFALAATLALATGCADAFNALFSQNAAPAASSEATESLELRFTLGEGERFDRVWSIYGPTVAYAKEPVELVIGLRRGSGDRPEERLRLDVDHERRRVIVWGAVLGPEPASSDPQAHHVRASFVPEAAGTYTLQSLPMRLSEAAPSGWVNPVITLEVQPEREPHLRGSSPISGNVEW